MLQTKHITRLSKLLTEFAKLRGEALSDQQAKDMGKTSFLRLDHNATYGGYRLTRVKLDNYSECGCYGIGDMDKRMNKATMELYLQALINANNP